MDVGLAPPQSERRFDATRDRMRSWVRAAGQSAAALRWMAQPLLIALGIRLLVFMVVGFGALLLASGQFLGFLRTWERKDALWYLDIAAHGYAGSAGGTHSLNFFPLYPLLVRLVQPVTGVVTPSNSYLAAGLVISWAAFAGACVLLYRLVLDRFDRGVASRSVLLLGTFPFSMFFGTVYSESLYQLFTAGAFLAAECRGWWLAGVLCLLNGATRPPCVLVGGCIAVAYLLDWRAARHRLRPDVLALGLAPVGALAYVVYCWRAFGDPLAYAHASWQGWHGGHLQMDGLFMFLCSLLHPLAWLLHPTTRMTIRGIYALLITACCLLAIPIWRMLGAPYALYTLASLLVPLLTYPTTSSGGAT
jgi:hypothetical protein